jgi:hypothetical protein
MRAYSTENFMGDRFDGLSWTIYAPKRRYAMGLFKKKVVKEIPGGAWGYLVNVHKMDVDTLARQFRCVEREGVLDRGNPVTFLRVFSLSDVQQRGINVTGWETFDQYPEMILFEGYLTKTNDAHLERRTK